MEMEKILKGIEAAADQNASSEETYIAEDGLLYCSKCHTKRQTEIFLFDCRRLVPCICKCMKEERDAQRAAEERREQMRYIERLRRAGFHNDDIASWTFETDNGSNQKVMDIMRKYVENFKTFRETGKGLLLYGNVGTGKTFAAACIANALIDKGVPCYMTNFAQITNAIQATFDGKEEYINNLLRHRLIIIDDLGIERKTEYMQEIVYSVIDAIYRAGVPLIITTNLSLEELKHPQNIAEARYYDRILERCFPVEVSGANQRRKKINADYQNTKELLGLCD